MAEKAPTEVDKPVVGAPITERTRQLFPGDQQIIRLSPLDQIAPRDYISLALFFKLPEVYDLQNVYSVLDDALASVIAEQPHLLGHIVDISNSSRHEIECRIDPRTEIDFRCKDWRTEQNAADWPWGSMDDLQARHFPTTFDLFNKIVPELRQFSDGSLKEPCFLAQANFIPRGLILIFRLHHSVTDGTGAVMLVEAWSRHANAIFSGKMQQLKMFPQAALDRSQLSSGDKAANMQHLPDWKLASQAQHITAPEDMQTEFATFHIPKAKVEVLRQEMTTPDFRPTQSETVSAVLWKYISRARRIDESGHALTALSTTVDARSRLGLHPRFIGCASEPNAVVRLPPTTVMHGAPAELARRIRAAIKAVDGPAVRRLIGVLNQMPSTKSILYDVNRWPGPDMLIINMSNAGWLDFNWGASLGCSLAVRGLAAMPKPGVPPDGRCVLNGCAGRNGFDCVLIYEDAVIQRLRQDPEFSQWFTYFD